MVISSPLLVSLLLLPVAPVAMVLVYWGRWGDRSKGRPRCPACWYDMRGTVPRLECPECGHDARHTRRLYQDRRRPRLVVLGVVLALLTTVPAVVLTLWPAVVWGALGLARIWAVLVEFWDYAEPRLR